MRDNEIRIRGRGDDGRFGVIRFRPGILMC